MTQEAKQKLFDEMEQHLLQDEQPSRFLKQLIQKKTFQQYPFRMLYLLSKTEQSPIYHPEGDAWVHTLMVVDEAAKVKQESSDPKTFMWAAMLHDIGKPDTTKLRKGRITSYGHDERGKALAKEFLEEFGCEKDWIKTVSALVEFHMHILYVNKNLKFSRISELKESTNIKDLALLGWCDRMGRTNADPEEEKKQITAFYQRLKS